MFSKVTGEKQHKLLSCIALFLCAMLLIGILFSSFYIAAESDHHCHGGDCPICQVLAVCEGFIDHIGSGLFIFAAVLAVINLLYVSDVIFTCSLKMPTLVSQKVRLNN